MKRIILIFTAVSATVSAFAQSPVVDTPKPKKAFTGDSLLSRFVIDVNVMGGVLSQNITAGNTAGNYLNGVNMNTNGSLNFSNGTTFGADGQVGFFFGEKRNFGVGTGFMYLYQQGDVTLNSFHAEYQSTDANGNIFRQLVTADGAIKEQLQVTNLNIPLVLKYKKRFSQLLGFSADAGVLFNIKESNAYNSNAAFNYEAVYDFPSGTTPSVYDNSPTPKSTDVLYTVPSYNTNPVHGSVSNYFNSYLPGQGFNTGYNVSPAKNTGTVSYMTGSVGFIVRPALDFFLSDNVALNVGVVYMYQSFKNTVPNGYMITNKVGDYSSVMNTVTQDVNQTIGANIGVRFFVGRKKTAVPPMAIQYIEATNPTYCGANDGVMILHGLYANQQVAVNYMLDGAPQAVHNDVVSADGTVTIRNLTAGAYTGIVATIGTDSAMGEPKTLVAPAMTPVSLSTENPSEDGKCDGSITVHGLRPRQSVAVYYNLNGSAQSPFASTSGSDGTVTCSNLCAGTYTHIVAAIGTCSSTAKDVTLINSAPAAPSGPSLDDLHKIATPILFETNQTKIQQGSLPTLDEAVKMLNEDKTTYIIVDGYTDITGKPSYNKVLSLKRAKAVKQKLMSMGIEAKRIRIEGHGSKDPVGDNRTREGRLKNRRAVMHLLVGE